MALNRSTIGKQFASTRTSVTVEAIQDYARACNDDNPFYFDPTSPESLVAPPMFGVVVIWQSILSAVTDSEVGADLLRLLHGEQDMRFLRPIRPGDEIESTATISSIETKATGETLTVEIAATLAAGKEPVLHALFGAFIRARGGARRAAPEAAQAEITGDPTVVESQNIDMDQTFRYAKASGDYNPIHTDEAVARMAGLPGLIVHGLCTMAFVSRVVIDRLCGRDPRRLRRLRVRFAHPVRPGDTITTRIWPDNKIGATSSFRLETVNGQGRKVIRDALAEVSAH